jgi:glucosamine 6-phosphate synthetase-like amidotransferase/phosphosugar isomerase protein
MCAIVGSCNLSRFEVLYEANVQRGNFSSGIICLTNNYDQNVIKVQGIIDFNKINLDEGDQYYVGHVQAPTSAKRVWSYDTSHPFESISWSVVHNGVLTNWEKLRAAHIDWDLNPVDTAVISNLLQHFTEECRGECPAHEIIKRVLEMLEGTFALCMVDTDTNEVYIARQGSTLHYNNSGDISTLPGKGFTLLPEGVIMNLQNNTWHEVNTFKINSPFLFL